MPRYGPVKIAIVGCGTAAMSQHIPAILRIDGVKLTAICHVNEVRMAVIKRHVGDVRCYNDFNQMLSDREIDIVDICTPPKTHAALAIKAAESGRHILVEKPATMTLEDFDQVVNACTQNRVKFCQVQNMMCIPTVINLISQVKKGNIGSVLEVNIIAMTRDRAILAREQPDHWLNQLPEGVFSDIAPHAIYLIQALLGVVEPVFSYRKDNDRICGAPSCSHSVILQGKSGIGTIAWSGPATRDKMIIDVIGALKNMRVDIGNATMFEYGMRGTSNTSIALENLRQSRSILMQSARAALDVILRRRQSGHFCIIRDFVRSVREGNDPPISIEKAREVVRIFEAIGRIEAINNVS